MVAIVINADATTTSCLTAYLIEKTSVTALNIPQSVGRVPVKPTGAFYVKVLTSLLKEVYVHLSVKVDYGHVLEESRFLSYHVYFSSISSIRCSSFAGGKQLEERIRELVTPTLGAANESGAPMMSANTNRVAKCARSKYLEATNASSAHQRPAIPWVKKESRWGPRYVLRKPSEPAAFYAEEAVPAADEAVPYVASQEAVASMPPAEVSAGTTAEQAVEAGEFASTGVDGNATPETVESPATVPEESSRDAPKESISTSPGKGMSLPAKEEKEGKGDKENIDDCFVSLEEASNVAFQSQIRDTMIDYITSLRSAGGMGEIDREFEREAMKGREEIFIRPSVRE